ncbi:MAG: serine hydrolase domain-containing protein [Mangrovibacterium sp.]
MKHKQLVCSGRLLRACFFLMLILPGIYSCRSGKINPRTVTKREFRKEIRKGRDAVRLYFISSNVPGVSVSVSIDGETVWSQGMGYANKELRVPVTPATRFRIGSTSRMLTAMLMARLQQEGKLSMGDSFYQYVPEYPGKQWDFTLYQLGVHTAGLPEDNPGELYSKSKKYKSLKDYVHAHAGDSLLFRPDDYYAVSDYGYSLLGILAEEISRKRFPALMKEMVLDTLKLTETQADNPYYLVENRSQCYCLNYIAQLTNAPTVDLSFCAPAHGFLSTADDLNKAARAAMDSTVFTADIRDLFFKPHQLSHGYQTNLGFGWWVLRDRENRPLYAQIGTTVGGSSKVLVYPEQKLVVSICSNLEDDNAQLPAREIARIFLDKLDPRTGSGKKEDANNNQAY